MNETVETNKTEAVLAFHRQRRMFALAGGEIHFAPVGDERDHKTWFSHSDWSRRLDIDDVMRGFVDPTGVYVYRGPHFFDPCFAESELAEHADLFEAPLDTPVWSGMQQGQPGERWRPLRSLGTLKDLIEKRVTARTEVRLKPETMRLVEQAAGSPEAAARLIRRAVGTGAEEKVLKLLQDECQPHDWKKVCSGQQSSELFECTRCDKRIWD